jgi:hypothetical protein
MGYGRMRPSLREPSNKHLEDIMKRLISRLLTMVAVISGLALGLSAQRTTATPARQDPDSSMSQTQSQVDTATPQRSAQSFEGTIMRSGEKLVLRENASKTAYQLDDQDKAKRYENKNVKVMATVDPESRVLHIVAITPVETD